MDENLLKIVNGVATTGSINIDGASAVRRTCQLSFISTELQAIDYFKIYKTKFLLEIDFGKGFKKCGIYLLTNFSSNLTTKNFTFNISGKDKMCLLNGEHGGSFPFSIDVGKKEVFDYNYEPLTTFVYEPEKYYFQSKGDYLLDHSPYAVANRTYYERLVVSQKVKLTIKEIINNVVSIYGREQNHNIFIYDLDIKGLELLEYRGADPLYLFRAADGKADKKEITIDPDTVIYINGEQTSISNFPETGFFSTSPIEQNNIPLKVQKELDGIEYYLLRLQYGDSLGYRDTDLVYAGELTANVNENVTTILDKIKNMLGNYEYFYNEEGHFIFQKRQDYTNNQFSSIAIDGLGIEYQQAPIIPTSFIDLKNIVSIGQNPQFQNIKNDFSIWGTRAGESGSLPIHSRIAIHKKPMEYCTYNGLLWRVDENKDSFLSFKRNVEINNQDRINGALDGMWQFYHNTVFPNLKEKYQEFYPEFIKNLYNHSKDNNIRYFYASLHWIWTVCEIIQKVDLGNRFEVSDEGGWSANPYFLIKNIFQKMLMATCNHPSNFGKVIVSLIEGEVKAGGYGEIKNFTDSIRSELENEIQTFGSQNIYYPTFSSENNGRAVSTLQFLTKDIGGNGIIGHCLRKGSAGEVFEAELIYNFLVNSILNAIDNNIKIMEICSKVYPQLGLSVREYNGVKWLSTDEDEEGDVILYYNLMAFPSLYTGNYTDPQPSWKDSIQNIVVKENEAVSKNCEDRIMKYNNQHGPSRATGSSIKVSDWREILYQMAKDYYDNGSNIDFWTEINRNNDNKYISRKTGYEAFYEDILGFWRQLYFDPLYEPLEYELPFGYDINDYWWNENDPRNGWHKDVFENPSGLNFWIDFIEPQGELANYAIDEIGVKGKYENSSTVKSIAVKQPPALKILTGMEWELLGENLDPNYTYIQLEGILANSYTISAQGISALEHTQNLLFNHTYLQESVTLSMIPDDSLEVNSRVSMDAINAQGEYTVSKITLPLAYNGMMSVTLTKIPPALTTEIIIKEFE